jgi:hypothetical protein
LVLTDASAPLPAFPAFWEEGCYLGLEFAVGD